MERILVCAAWPYANGSLHLGHIAGAYLPADTYVRYLRAGDTVGTQTPRTTVVTYAQPDGYALAQQGAA